MRERINIETINLRLTGYAPEVADGLAAALPGAIAARLDGRAAGGGDALVARLAVQIAGEIAAATSPGTLEDSQ